MLLADYVIEWLTNNDINNIFTVSGGGSIALCDALTKSNSMSYYCCHHEQAAAFAAEGYARASGKVGATLVTTGPGGTNALTGVSSAWIDSIPLIFISGQVFSNQLIGKSKLRQLGVQEINIIDLVKPNTKYAVCLKSPNDIKYELEKLRMGCNISCLSWDKKLGKDLAELDIFARKEILLQATKNT